MRQSNIELCRIVAIILIILLHTGFQLSGVPTSIEETSLIKLLMQSFSNVGVDVFILITGFFSAQPKLKSIINLAYICLLCAVFSSLVGYLCDIDFPINRILFITRSNWFIPSYICLLFFAPVLNKFCNSLSNKEFIRIGGGILLTVTWFGWYPAKAQVPLGLNYGCSLIWFIVVYLIGRYIRLYDTPKWFSRYSVLIYTGLSILTAVGVYVVLSYMPNHSVAAVGLLYANNSPLMIIAAIAFFVWFKNLKVNPSKFINYISQSVLAVLLLHGCMEVSLLKKNFYGWLTENFSGIPLGALWILSVIAMFIICVLIDQFRILSYKPIKKVLDSKLKY